MSTPYGNLRTHQIRQLDGEAKYVDALVKSAAVPVWTTLIFTLAVAIGAASIAIIAFAYARRTHPSDGLDGAEGPQGAAGRDGRNGTNGVNGANGYNGTLVSILSATQRTSLAYTIPLGTAVYDTTLGALCIYVANATWASFNVSSFLVLT
jgi:hypothetical protein